jgi:hypothetical protein
VNVAANFDANGGVTANFNIDITCAVNLNGDDEQALNQEAGEALAMSERIAAEEFGTYARHEEELKKNTDRGKQYSCNAFLWSSGDH